MGIGLQIFVWKNECELKVHSNIYCNWYMTYEVHVFNINRFPKSYHQFLYGGGVDCCTVMFNVLINTKMCIEKQYRFIPYQGVIKIAFYQCDICF